MKYWLIVTSPENFRYDREVLKFKVQGLPNHFRKQVQKMEIGDRVVYYIMKLQRFWAKATITGQYFNDTSRLEP
jgi:predicted RNA-binding protein with PUA-like domain